MKHKYKIGQRVRLLPPKRMPRIPAHYAEVMRLMNSITVIKGHEGVLPSGQPLYILELRYESGRSVFAAEKWLVPVDDKPATNFVNSLTKLPLILDKGDLEDNPYLTEKAKS